MLPALATAVLLFVGVSGVAGQGPPASADPSDEMTPETTAATGTVRGSVSLDLPPPRRSADRYAGRGGAPREVQRIPAVVYLVRPGGDPEPPSRAIMAQQDTAFSPAVLVVPRGTTVEFPNRDPFFHNVFSYSSPARFDLGRYPRGVSKEVTFDEPGVVKLYCEVHDTMRGAILVAGAARWTAVAGDGSFVLEEVPSGTWTLVAWHADLGTVEREVTVPDGGEVRVDLALG